MIVQSIPAEGINGHEDIKGQVLYCHEVLYCHDPEPGFDLFDQRPASGQPVEIPRENGPILVLDPDWRHGELSTTKYHSQKFRKIKLALNKQTEKLPKKNL